MQNQDRILRLIVLIVVLALAVAASNSTYAQQNIELHQKTLDFLYEKPPNSKQVANIATGNDPRAIAVDKSTHKIYVANSGDNTVSVINGTSNTKILDIVVGLRPIAIGVDPSLNKIYVANSGSSSVSIIDGRNYTNVKDIHLGISPCGIGVYPDLNKIYVAGHIGRRDSVSIINGNNDTYNPRNVINVGRFPCGIGVNVGEIYVANRGNNTVSVIDATSDKKIHDIHVGRDPTAIGTGYPPTDRHWISEVYVANAASNSISVISGYRTEEDIHVGSHPTAIGVDPSTNTKMMKSKTTITLSIAAIAAAALLFATDPIVGNQQALAYGWGGWHGGGGWHHGWHGGWGWHRHWWHGGWSWHRHW